jgi:sugar lactone lactonase YvrE
MVRPAAMAACGIVFSLIAHADSSRTRQASISRFLVSVPGEGVLLFDLKGSELWSFRCDPYDACETGRGRILVTDRRAGRVFAVTREGHVVWEKAGLQGPVNAEPLDNGNALLLENDSGRVLEVTPAGEVAREIGGHRTPFDARRRSNGNTVVADSGANRIVEYDSQGRQIRETAGLKFPNSLCLLPGGRTLFTTYTNGTIGELDGTGALMWERKIGGTLYSVAVEGNTFWVSDGIAGRVVQVARDGTLLREIKLPKTFVDLAFCR